MKMLVKAIDPETGDAVLEGFLNRTEINYLVGFAISELISDGIKFNISMDEPDDDDEARIEYPNGSFN